VAYGNEGLGGYMSNLHENHVYDPPWAGGTHFRRISANRQQRITQARNIVDGHVTCHNECLGGYFPNSHVKHVHDSPWVGVPPKTKCLKYPGIFRGYSLFEST
jgi:hypothetical protein